MRIACKEPRTHQFLPFSIVRNSKIDRADGRTIAVLFCQLPLFSLLIVEAMR